MNLIELGAYVVIPDVQGKVVEGSDGRAHAVSVASCAVGNSLRRAQRDWYAKYPNYLMR